MSIIWRTLPNHIIIYIIQIENDRRKYILEDNRRKYKEVSKEINIICKNHKWNNLRVPRNYHKFEITMIEYCKGRIINNNKKLQWVYGDRKIGDNLSR